MKYSGLYFVIALITICKYQATSETVEEFIEMLRNKVRHLEASNQITRDYEPYSEPELQDHEEYDFIIVGAGSGGSAVIHRLSEIAHWKILVLEAGGEPDILSDIPFWSVMLESTELDWKFLTEKEDNFALGLEGQRMRWPRGKGLGGSSLLNYITCTRGAKEDYQRWARLGNPGWAYEDVLPFFKKLETSKVKGHDDELRGHDGPIFVETTVKSKGSEIFVEAAKNAGYKYVDYNGHEHRGVSHVQSAVKNGFRCSGERCYIKPIKNRKNLTIRLHSHVTKVLIEDRTAYGVEFVKNGKTYKALARKEVILSAGVINSPHILLLSGIGPKEQLLNYGIEPMKDLPVGRKIYDHPVYWGLSFTLNESIGYDIESALSDEAFKELYNEGQGILREVGESILFVQTPLASSEVADVEIIFYSAHFSKDFEKGPARMIGLSKSFYEKMYKSYEGQIVVTCPVVLLHPESFGHLELRSSDPFDHPKLYGGYYTDPEGKDVKTMIAGIREAMKIMLSPPFDKYGIKFIDKPMVGCEKYEYDSDEYIECTLRHLSSTLFHHSTTCKMGPADDPEAVVDNRLRVYGINNLRVADASVIPIPLTAHINVPTYLVGEKAADMIKEEYLL